MVGLSLDPDLGGRAGLCVCVCVCNCAVLSNTQRKYLKVINNVLTTHRPTVTN